MRATHPDADHLQRDIAKPIAVEQHPDMLRRLVKRDAIFPPVVPVGEDLKLLAIQGMKGMGHREKSLR